MSRPAVFLDRDGTVCREVGYVNHLDRMELLPGAAEAIRRIREADRLALVVTNQAGAARGYFPLALIDAAHRRLGELLAREGASVDAIYHCPHHPDVGPPGLRRACDCRKPAPGMLLRGRDELGADLDRSWIVGDSFKDIEAGANAGVPGVLVRTGYGLGELEHFGDVARVTPAHVADDLPAAVEWILGRPAEAR
jgi:D-glycero-D-manno-heptose 1,7-bisphosphate phosphatase